MTAQTVRIGLVIAHSLAFYRRILHGVRNYATNRPEWLFTPIATDLKSLELVKPLHCDGYIAHIFHRPLGLALKSLRRPVINVSGVLPELPFPRVISDHAAVGRLAAEHLLSCGLKQLAFVGYRTHEFSTERERGLRTVAEQNGVRVQSFYERNRRLEDPTGVWRWNAPLLDWLRKLEKPVGILASHDTQGAQVAEYCHQLQFTVPDQVAIVGVDDDDVLCELSRPSLSSVMLPAERIGFEAARILDEWMNGRRSTDKTLVLPPAGVIVRQSSNLQSVPDSDVAAAVRFIHGHAHEPITVADLLQAVPIARRALERRFRKWLQRSLLDEIRRAHIERAKHLLLTTDLPMSEIANHAGLSDSRNLSITFRKVTGMTPTQFRRQIQTHTNDLKQ
ncbi:MAG: DNA-binding transcriptional regulator [Planctomycetes bacterium]|nr:DNA-binding transcriptional regulator [Planctomycetota bacterium]